MNDQNRYDFTEEPSDAGYTLLRWTKNGHYDPLDFWHVPDSFGLEEAKRRVRAGEFDD